VPGEIAVAIVKTNATPVFVTGTPADIDDPEIRLAEVFLKATLCS